MSNETNTTTFGVKVTAEVKEQLQKALAESGLQGKEFMEALLNTYKVSEVKNSTPIIAGDLEELQTLTKRINGIYVNMASRISTLTQDQKEEFEEKYQSQQSEMSKYKVEIDELNAKIRYLKEKYELELTNKNTEITELTELNQKLNNRVEELEQGNSTMIELNMKYKQENEKLTLEIKECEHYKVDLDEHKKLLAEIQRREIELNNELNISKKNKEELANKIQLITQENIKLLVQQKKELELEHKSNIIDIKEEQQQQQKELNEKYNKEIEEYQEKYKQLLKELEQYKKSPAVIKAKSKGE